MVSPPNFASGGTMGVFQQLTSSTAYQLFFRTPRASVLARLDLTQFPKPSGQMGEIGVVRRTLVAAAY
jgi:hypothetical protein